MELGHCYNELEEIFILFATVLNKSSVKSLFRSTNFVGGMGLSL